MQSTFKCVLLHFYIDRVIFCTLSIFYCILDFCYSNAVAKLLKNPFQATHSIFFLLKMDIFSITDKLHVQAYLYNDQSRHSLYYQRQSNSFLKTKQLC